MVSSNVRHLRCVEFGINVAIRKHGMELKMAALSSSDKRRPNPINFVNFNSYLPRSGSGVLLAP